MQANPDRADSSARHRVAPVGALRRWLVAACLLPWALAACNNDDALITLPNGGEEEGTLTPKYVYVTNSADNTVSMYDIDLSTGALSEFGTPVGASVTPAAIATDPLGEFAWVANSAAATVSAYTVDADTGELSQVGSPVGADTGTVGIAAHPSGDFVYTANSGGTVSAFAVDRSTGALTLIENEGTSNSVWDVAIDSSGYYLYTGDSTGQVHGFEIDDATGALTTLPGSPYALTDAAGLMGMAVHPDGTYLFAVSATNNNHHGMTIDPGDGSLTESFGPVNFTSNAPRGMAIDPTGAYLYTAWRFGNSISGLEVAGNGDLASTAQHVVSSPLNPWRVSMDPTGQYLYVANFVGDSVSAWSVDLADGTLTLVGGAAEPAGNAPQGVAVLSVIE